MTQRLLRAIGALVIVATLTGLQKAGAADSADLAETRRLHQLFDARWEVQMRTYPEWATYVGDPRYGDRLYDASPAAVAAEFASSREALTRARAIRRDALSALDRSSLDVFIHQTEDGLRYEPFVGFRSMSLGALGGFQTEFSELLRASPVSRRAEVEQILARMAAYPARVEQELARLREGAALRWVPPRSVLERALALIDGQLTPQPDASPFFEPFTRLPGDMPVAERDELRARGRSAIADHVAPALRRLRSFVADEYLPAAPATGSLGSYPGGAQVYAQRVRTSTTTELTPTQLHAIGQRELARLRPQMEAVMKEVGFGGSFEQFVEYLYNDPKFFHASGEALLAGYRDIAKRIDPELPRLFATLPRASYGVRAMPAHISSDAAEFYSGPALDGSRPGWFNANAQGFRKRPIWSMETLAAHEAVPGHHLQIARAVELGELPKFRRADGYEVFGEGWALYAETLGFDLGLYKDPLSRFGHLQDQALRAARLVVDTGIHAFGWSRSQAIEFMIERTGKQRPFVTSEVDRYISWPAQALAYMIGELKIIELRDRAKARLGERFDIRRFHGIVLDQGSVPLPVLERAVDEWIAAGGGAAASPSKTANPSSKGEPR
ncbi:MAG: DUF885 domain-containing protein [Burkholderiaceae bacterium]